MKQFSETYETVHGCVWPCVAHVRPMCAHVWSQGATQCRSFDWPAPRARQRFRIDCYVCARPHESNLRPRPALPPLPSMRLATSHHRPALSPGPACALPPRITVRPCLLPLHPRPFSLIVAVDPDRGQSRTCDTCPNIAKHSVFRESNIAKHR